MDIFSGIGALFALDIIEAVHDLITGEGKEDQDSKDEENLQKESGTEDL